jgi:biotin carboxyl carrier protein
MKLRSLGSLVKWTAALLVLGALLAAAQLVHEAVKGERAAEAGRDAVELPKRTVNSVIKLGAELAESHGIQEKPAVGISWYPGLVTYGRVVPNPQATTEIRSPFAGTLRPDPDVPWVVPGRWVRAGQVLGYVDIRIGPQDRLDLVAKLADARVQERGAQEILKVQEERVNRLKQSSGTAAVPQSEVDDALVKLADAKNQLARAQSAIELWQKAVNALQRRKAVAEAGWSEALTAPADGEVTELLGRPGMAIEAGGIIARVVDFRRLLVRLDLPAEVLTTGPPAQVDLSAVAAGQPALGGSPTESCAGSAVIRGILIGQAPQVEVGSQLVSYWYEVAATAPKGSAVETDAPTPGTNGPGMTWRPGLFVKASLRAPCAKPQEAVSVPRGAVLFHQGRALVYVRIGPGKFERREVRILGADGNRWALAAGDVAVGEPVVYRQAQVLLSEEFRGDVDND